MKFTEIMKEKGLDAVALEQMTLDHSNAFLEKIRSGEIIRPSSMRNHYPVTSNRIQLFLDRKGDPTLDEIEVLARVLGVPERKLSFEVLDKITGEIRVEKIRSTPSFSIR